MSIMWTHNHMASRFMRFLLRSRKHSMIWVKSMYLVRFHFLVIPEAGIEIIQL